MLKTVWTRLSKYLIDPILHEIKSEESKQSVWFTTSSALKTLIQMVTSLIVARMILPENIGIWKSIVLIQSYINILQLGVLEGLNRQYPLYKGAGKDQSAIERAHVAYTYMIYVSILSGIIVLILATIFLVRGSGTKTLVAILLFTLQAISTPLWKYDDILYRTERDFSSLGWIQFAESIYLIISLIFVYFGDWLGMMIRFSLIFPVGLLLREIYRPIPVDTKFNKQYFIEMVKIGWKVMLSVYLYGILMVADTTIIAMVLGQKQLGYYTVAVTIRGAIVVFPNAINKILYPRMAFRYGKTKTPAELKKIAFLPVFYNALILLVPTIFLWFTLDPLVTVILPQYTNGISAAKWMVIASYFMGLRSSVLIFRTLNRIETEIVLILASIVLMYLLGLWSANTFGSITSVSIANMAVMGLLTIGLNIYAYQMVNGTERA